ncbi:hypothetical protein [Corallococcus llansteffanensis]|uniref:hypothetical protein n=1 Tax=Corallococcus llansteffanensis TaxID=2316731 RepID=UPI001ABF9430|nr:hypothetical protein [Corallococcus llansteffanensis]
MASPFLRVPWCFLLLALTGCEPALPQDPEAEALGTSEADIRIANSLTTQELVLNAIAANHDANEALSTNSLESLFDPDVMVAGPDIALIANQLHDPHAQRFMAYLVGCALGPNETLEWLNPFQPPGSQRSQWAGSAGLCPEWRTSAPLPDSACLKRVTACLLARNNGLGHRVELSMRGEIHEPLLSIDQPFALDQWTAPLDHIPGSPVSINSGSPCSSAAVGSGRDCGWTMHSVGWCPAGQTVSVGAGGPMGGPAACPSGTPLGSSSGARMMLRVCRGIAGCDSTDGRLVANSQGCAAGSTFPLPSPATDPSVSVTCPAQGGYFTVMTAPWNSGATGTANVAVSGGAQAPLSERGVYRVREGAFYGNLFGTDALRDDIDVLVTLDKRDRYVITRPTARQSKPIFNNLYSCYDPGWVYGLAYATYRVCALPGTNEDCAATVTGPCWDANPSAPRQCKVEDGPLLTGDGDFEDCKDPLSNHWMEPVTVFLNGACDLVDDEHRELCLRRSEPPPPREGQGGVDGKTPVEPRKR